MDKCVIVLEDDVDLAHLVDELLTTEGYITCIVDTPELLLAEAAVRAPCVALVDSRDPVSYDMWWIGPELAGLGVPPVAFTAHSSARTEFQADSHDFVAVIEKPFDAQQFLDVVDAICWDVYSPRVAS